MKRVEIPSMNITMDNLHKLKTDLKEKGYPDSVFKSQQPNRFNFYNEKTGLFTKVDVNNKEDLQKLQGKLDDCYELSLALKEAAKATAEPEIIKETIKQETETQPEVIEEGDESPTRKPPSPTGTQEKQEPTTDETKVEQQPKAVVEEKIYQQPDQPKPTAMKRGIPPPAPKKKTETTSAEVKVEQQPDQPKPTAMKRGAPPKAPGKKPVTTKATTTPTVKKEEKKQTADTGDFLADISKGGVKLKSAADRALEEKKEDASQKETELMKSLGQIKGLRAAQTDQMDDTSSEPDEWDDVLDDDK